MKGYNWMAGFNLKAVGPHVERREFIKATNTSKKAKNVRTGRGGKGMTPGQAGAFKDMVREP